MVSERPVGGRVIAIPRQRLWWAVDAVVDKLGRQQAGKLDVRAGEHLAAILTTAFLGIAPGQVDTAGGVDLSFDLGGAAESTGVFAPGATEAAFEVKSLPGEFRKFDGRMGQDHSRGVDTTGRSLRVPIRAANDVMAEAVPWLRRAADQLARKAKTGSSRNAFLVIHSLDYMTIECVKYPVIARALAPLEDLDNLDTVWALWVPSHLAMWSVSRQEWTDLLFSTTTADEIELSQSEDDDLDVLQEVEEHFLRRIGYDSGSPYIFRLA